MNRGWGGWGRAVREQARVLRALITMLPRPRGVISGAFN